MIRALRRAWRAVRTPDRILALWLTVTWAGQVFLACAGWRSALGGAFGLPALVGLPAEAALGFLLLVLFHRAIRRSAAPQHPDESRLLGFFVPAVLPFLRPLVEVGLLQSAAGLSAQALGTPRLLRVVVVLSWARAALELLAWGAAATAPTAAVAVLASGASLVLLALILHVVTWPLVARERERRAGQRGGTRSAGCEDSVAVGAFALGGLASPVRPAT